MILRSKVQVQLTLIALEERKCGNSCVTLASSGSAVVEHLPRDPKVKGSSPSLSVSTERENVRAVV
jgi:hypothetical protein